MKLRRSELEHLLRTVHSRVLHRPQCSERSQLGLGQALDACDIQSLIGPVTAQCAAMLSALHVPQHDSPVLPATGQRTSIGTHLERLHRTLMCFLIPVPQTGFPHAFPALHIPPAQPAITASAHYQVTTRNP